MCARTLRVAVAGAVLLSGAIATVLAADDDGWIELGGPRGLDAWKSPTDAWTVVGAVRLKSENPKLLAADAGAGVLYNGPAGRTRNLVSKQSFGDIEAHIEFLVPKGSNSGVKLEGLYEVQIYDSWGVDKPKASDCGGIYHRAELLPTYHHIDDGYPPKVNASRAPGEWQTLDITFHAPRFDTAGKKLADARFDKVLLNGRIVQENLAVPTPTGHAWRDQEHPKGPLLLQGDHGPVAFRSVRVRPLP